MGILERVTMTKDMADRKVMVQLQVVMKWIKGLSIMMMEAAII
jgi:hypothetical protein